MIERYTRSEMGKLWSDTAKYDLWLTIELAVCEAWGQQGEIPQETVATIRARARYDMSRITAVEREVKHDVIAFLTVVGEHIGPEARYLHLGMTSSDLLDTAFACQLARAGQLIAADCARLLDILKRRAHEYKMTPMIGRSHGMHAEPITFGLKLALWYDEFMRQRARLAQAIAEVSVGKCSGAVGTYAHMPPAIEQHVCAKLGLQPAAAASQVVSRDRHAHFFSVLAGIAASMEKVAVEIRHLQRSEVGEVAEGFTRGQKGSSAMPHKRNPVLAENITGLSRLVRSYAQAALENVSLWHERDISHSSVERVIGPDATTLVDFMLVRLADLIDQLEVFPERMAENLKAAHGLFASQDVMLALVKSGMPREAAYRLVQNLALTAAKDGKDFRELVTADAFMKQRLTNDDIAHAFSLEHYVQHVETIFEKVFGGEEKWRM